MSVIIYRTDVRQGGGNDGAVLIAATKFNEVSFEMKDYKLKDFVKLCTDEKFKSYIFSSENQDGSGVVYYSLHFDKVAAFPLQSVLCFSDKATGNKLSFKNVNKIHLGRTIPSFGTEVIIDYTACTIEGKKPCRTVVLMR